MDCNTKLDLEIPSVNIIKTKDEPSKIKKNCGTNTPPEQEENEVIEEEINTESAPTAPDDQINLFTCYIGPCREERNANFEHPEFMICYKDKGSHPSCDNNSMVRYFCCPLAIAAVEKDGETSYELRTLPVSERKQESRVPPGNHHEEWRNYYHQHQQNYTTSGGQQPWHFLYHYCCSCPPQMTAQYLHCQGLGHQQQQHQQQSYMPNFAYQNYPYRSSAMG